MPAKMTLLLYYQTPCTVAICNKLPQFVASFVVTCLQGNIATEYLTRLYPNILRLYFSSAHKISSFLGNITAFYPDSIPTLFNGINMAKIVARRISPNFTSDDNLLDLPDFSPIIVRNI